MLIIFTGDGKGKTTAAIGQALRAIGNGSRVLMIQFIKGPWKSGEHDSAELLSPHFKIIAKGNGFVYPTDDEARKSEHRKSAADALAYAEAEARSGNWDIIILDEIWVARSLGLITSEQAQSAIEACASCADHVIATGRGCPAEFIEKADLVTEMKEVKHSFHKGVLAVKGIEY